jgi:hypothetical protein
MYMRAGTTLILLIAACTLPLWFWGPLGIIAAWFFPVYWELGIVAFVADALFGAPGASLLGTAYMGTFMAVLVVLAVWVIQKFLFTNKGLGYIKRSL